jgi:hypothetical protein
MNEKVSGRQSGIESRVFGVVGQVSGTMEDG